MNFFPEFLILLVGALIGSAAVVPYGLRLAGDKLPKKISYPALFLLSLIQNAVISALAIWVGLLAARAVGLGAPYIEALLSGRTFSGVGPMTAILFGVMAGALLLVADLFFLPYWPEALVEIARKTTLPENFLASIYGGINEELLMRLFGFSSLAWLLSLAVPLNMAALWTSNVIMTVLFGLGHLPALKKAVGGLPSLMVIRSLLLNAPVGLLCGWLFWTYGIETAIIAHFSADIVYHVFGTMVLRRKIG